MTTSQGSGIGSLPKLQGHVVAQLHASMTSPRIRQTVAVDMMRLPYQFSPRTGEAFEEFDRHSPDFAGPQWRSSRVCAAGATGVVPGVVGNRSHGLPASRR
jgi:hypothetical protein